MSPDLFAIARHFSSVAITGISALGNGLINDTYLVSSDAAAFVLQRINQQVFSQPERVIANALRLNRHIAGLPSNEIKLDIPGLMPTCDGKYFIDVDNQIWRALPFVADSESRERIVNEAEALQIGSALAHFHRLCADLPADALYDTLPGFHITPHYLTALDTVLTSCPKRLAEAEVAQCVLFVEQNRVRADVLEQAKQQGKLLERVIHGDPKTNNFLFRVGSDCVISLIDLDTVKPGLVHYDIGDCIRSSCHIEVSNQLDLARCQQILTAYCTEAKAFFSDYDYQYLADAIWLIPFELGLRFLTDYLQGDVYFKVHYPEHNLHRAQAQFALSSDIERRRAQLDGMVEHLRLV